MHYIIQDNMFQKSHHQGVIDELERKGLSYETVRWMPFIDEIEFTPVETNNIFVFGTPNTSFASKRYGWYPGSLYNENHDFEVQLEKYGKNMLNAECWIVEFLSILPYEVPNLFFARPVKDSKIFSGQEFTKQAWVEYVVTTLEQGSSGSITDETKIVISKPKNIEQEVRCWIVDGKFVTCSLYRRNFILTKENYDREEAFTSFAQKMADIYCPAEAFVLDICTVNGEFKIVEINCINAAGFYEANMNKLITALEDKFNI